MELINPGTRVGFLMKTFKQTDYGKLSEDGNLNQAIVVWVKDDPPQNKSRLLRAGLGKENTLKLENDRKTFMIHDQLQQFMVCSLVRVQGRVAGYITDTLGVINIGDKRDKSLSGKVFFHADDVLINKKSIR